MRSNTIVIVAVVLAVIAGIFIVKNRFGTNQTPTPSPNLSSSATPIPSIIPATAFDASSAATIKKIVDTKSGKIAGTTTQTTSPTILTPSPTTTTHTNLYDTSFDSWSIINYPGQSYEKQLVLKNKSDQPVMYAARAATTATNPVTVNGSYEATGKMLPLSEEVIKLKAVSSDQTPGYTTTVTINFIDQNQHIVATKTVVITAYTAVGDRTEVLTDTPTEVAGNQTATVSYRPLAAYPIRINNRNQRALKFTAKIISGDAAKVMQFSAPSGVIKPGAWWDTDLHFQSPNAKVNQVTVEFTFTPEDGTDPYQSVKTLTLIIN
jgi:hypothetical protein